MANPFPFVASTILTAAELNGIGEWTSYTPLLTGSTTNPTLGTGATSTGKYSRIQNLIIYKFSIFFGTSGFVAGVGNYRISLPVNSTGGKAFYSSESGQTSFYDSSANAPYYADIWMSSASQITIQTQPTLNGVLGILSATTPVIPANNDAITGLVIYEAA